MKITFSIYSILLSLSMTSYAMESPQVEHSLKHVWSDAFNYISWKPFGRQKFNWSDLPVHIKWKILDFAGMSPDMHIPSNLQVSEYDMQDSSVENVKGLVSLSNLDQEYKEYFIEKGCEKILPNKQGSKVLALLRWSHSRKVEVWDWQAKQICDVYESIGHLPVWNYHEMEWHPQGTEFAVRIEDGIAIRDIVHKTTRFLEINPVKIIPKLKDDLKRCSNLDLKLYIKTLAYNPDGSVLFAGLNSNRYKPPAVMGWSTVTGQCIYRCERPKYCHGKRYSSEFFLPKSLFFIDEGRSIVVTSGTASFDKAALHYTLQLDIDRKDSDIDPLKLWMVMDALSKTKAEKDTFCSTCQEQKQFTRYRHLKALEFPFQAIKSMILNNNDIVLDSESYRYYTLLKDKLGEKPLDIQVGLQGRDICIDDVLKARNVTINDIPKIVDTNDWPTIFEKDDTIESRDTFNWSDLPQHIKWKIIKLTPWRWRNSELLKIKKVLNANELACIDPLRFYLLIRNLRDRGKWLYPSCSTKYHRSDERIDAAIEYDRRCYALKLCGNTSNQIDRMWKQNKYKLLSNNEYRLYHFLQKKFSYDFWRYPNMNILDDKVGLQGRDVCIYDYLKARSIDVDREHYAKRKKKFEVQEMQATIQACSFGIKLILDFLQ